MRGGEGGRETERDGKKNNNMNFSLLSSMDFPLQQISVGPDETKVIRETQVGHLRAITAKRTHCLWSKPNTASLVRKSPVLFYLPSHACAVD